MNQYITGTTIRELREKHGMTQLQLAEKLCVSDKTISKWETGRGYPDITLLESIANAFHISVTELITGYPVVNRNGSSNVIRSGCYVCPVCGNVIWSMGEAAISCHGILLRPEEAQEPDARHPISVEPVEDEYYITIGHEMTKQHFISFIAALSPDSVQVVKLYPEGIAECRVKQRGVQQLLFYCNRDGLFRLDTRRKKLRR